MTTWITSDTHFGHENIIKYCSRPYRNAAQMDEDLIRRWNNRVKPGELVYHLGDVGMTKGDDYLPKILTRLNGRKILILGNHDKSAKRMMEFGFDFACEALVVMCCQRRLLLNHRPLMARPCWVGDPAQSVDYVLHGHIHNSTPEERAKHTAKGELVDILSFNINMSVEMTNYEPVPLEWVVKKKIAQDKQGMKVFS